MSYEVRSGEKITLKCADSKKREYYLKYVNFLFRYIEQFNCMLSVKYLDIQRFRLSIDGEEFDLPPAYIQYTDTPKYYYEDEDTDEPDDDEDEDDFEDEEDNEDVDNENEDDDEESDEKEDRYGAYLISPEEMETLFQKMIDSDEVTLEIAYWIETGLCWFSHKFARKNKHGLLMPLGYNFWGVGNFLLSPENDKDSLYKFNYSSQFWNNLLPENDEEGISEIINFSLYSWDGCNPDQFYMFEYNEKHKGCPEPVERSVITSSEKWFTEELVMFVDIYGHDTESEIRDKFYDDIYEILKPFITKLDCDDGVDECFLDLYGVVLDQSDIITAINLSQRVLDYVKHLPEEYRDVDVRFYGNFVPLINGPFSVISFYLDDNKEIVVKNYSY